MNDQELKATHKLGEVLFKEVWYTDEDDEDALQWFIEGIAYLQGC